MSREIIKAGDIFVVPLDKTNKQYFQYIGNDSRQLNSNVIRVFKKKYLINDSPTLDDIISGEIDFHAHTIIKWGIKMNVWTKLGNVKSIGGIENILFRDTNDYLAKPENRVLISQNWYIWRINDNEFHKIGELEGEYKKSEIGIVISAPNIVHRMKTGNFDFFYPKYE